MKEQITILREWAATRARAASSASAPAPAEPPLEMGDEEPPDRAECPRIGTRKARRPRPLCPRKLVAARRQTACVRRFVQLRCTGRSIMSDRFDFLEIDDGRRSPVRWVSAKESGRPASLDRVEPPGHSRAPTAAASGGRPTDVEPPMVWRAVETLGGPGSRIGEFRSPTGLTVDRLGNLYVADTLNHRVQRIARDGGVSVVDGARGAPEEPVAVAVDDDLAFYIISRREPGRIYAYGADGTLRWRWRVPGARPGTDQAEGSLVVDRGTLLLLDAGSARLLRIRLPETGRQPSVLEAICRPMMTHPRGVCADRRGRLIVGEASRQEIVALQRRDEGAWAPTWRRPLTELGLGGRASQIDITADGAGRLFVGVSHAGWATLAPDDGRGRRLELHGMPNEPASGSLALGPDGSLYVSSGSRRIYRFMPAS